MPDRTESVLFANEPGVGEDGHWNGPTLVIETNVELAWLHSCLVLTRSALSLFQQRGSCVWDIAYFPLVHINVADNFFVIKPNRCTNFTNLFCRKTLHVSDSSSVHHQEFIHRTLSNGWNVVPSWSCSKAVYKPVWHTIAECTVNKLLMIDRRTVRNMWSFTTK
jgi:hypothetical protein